MANYLPDPTSDWLAAVRGGVVLVTPASASPELSALWPALADDDPTSQVLDRLTAAGLAATPSFALVVRDRVNGSARVVVRGELTVRADDVLVSGAGVSTWTERVLESTSFEVMADAAASTEDTGLVVVEAIVPARLVRSDGIERVADAAPAPPSRVAVAEQTMVPAEDTVAAPSTPARAMPAQATPVPSTPAMPVVPPAAPAGPLDGDHDGLTIANVDLQRLRAERAASRGAPAAASVDVLPAVADAAGSRPAPVAGAASLRMPDGAIEALGPGVVLGRAPSVSQVSGGRLPRLVTIGAGDPDISRNHVRFALEGGTVVVTDLHSRNGTHVVAPGKPPVKLRAGEPTPVLAGIVVDLGGGWTVQVVAD